MYGSCSLRNHPSLLDSSKYHVSILYDQLRAYWRDGRHTWRIGTFDHVPKSWSFHHNFVPQSHSFREDEHIEGIFEVMWVNNRVVKGILGFQLDCSLGSLREQPGHEIETMSLVYRSVSYPPADHLGHSSHTLRVRNASQMSRQHLYSVSTEIYCSNWVSTGICMYSTCA